MKIAVIAGTSEATELIAALPAEDTVTAFAATAYGKEILAGQYCTVHVGRLDTEGFRQALRGMHAVVDASHPFAQEVTKTVRQVCTELQLPYFVCAFIIRRDMCIILHICLIFSCPCSNA